MLVVPSAAEARTYWLDTYEVNVKRFIGPKRTQKLDRNDPYVATVRGTFSFFGAAAYKDPYCGNVERSPIYPSLGRRNGPVNADVEFTFADMTRSCTRRNNNPISGQRFEIAVASKYKDYKPFGRGELKGPHPTHKYKYALIGTGRKVGFRLRETFAEDNYGRIRIAIRRARASECAKGFSAFGYADEAQCVAAVTAATS